MWQELDALPPAQQIVTCGEWITRMTQTLLPALGTRRRDMVLEALRAPEMDYSTLADTIGARRQTIVRLAEEGRAAARGQRE